MKTCTTLLALLLLPIVAVAAGPAATQAPPKIEDSLLAAARAGDAAEVLRVIVKSEAQQSALDKTDAKELLDALVRGGELRAFTVLLGELRKTIAGKDWQPDDALLAEVIRAGRRDLIDAMFASWLDPARLESKRDAGDAAMGEWIARRVAEVRQQRADQDEFVAAAGTGDLATMRRLLDAGVNVNCVATSRHTPLTFAAVKSQTAAVRLLLERGADADQPKHPGWDYTPLCLTKFVEIAELLKAHGANVHAKLFKRDVSILTYIAGAGGADMVAWMLKQGLDPKMIGDNNQNLLFDAGDARTVELLLAAGVDPNHVDQFGRTPLSCAQDRKIARKLIAAGARVEGDDSLIMNMVSRYASAGAIEAVIEARGKLDPFAAQRALITASHIDAADAARLLLKHGAKANEKGQWGASPGFQILPLQVCTIHGSPKVAKVLLEHGADPNGGEWPGGLLHAAIMNRHPDVAKILRDAGAKGVSDLAFFIARKDNAKVRELLQAAPRFAEQPEFWVEVLPTAARLGELDCVRAAIEKGVPLAPKPENPANPANPLGNVFNAAAHEGQHEVLAELLAHRGKSEDVSDLRQPLWSAVWNSHPYDNQRPAEAFEKCVKLLLDAGAFTADERDPATIDPEDELPEVSVLNAVFTRNPGGNPKVVEMLVAAGADPNPLISGDKDKPQRLSDVIQTACTQQGCSTPLARTIEAVEKAAKVVIKR